jgi:hypothetical protein
MELFGTYWQGEVFLETEAHEARNSCWVYSPRFVESSTSHTIFDLRGTLWDLMSVVESDEALLLEMRKYPGDRPPVILTIQRKGLNLYLGALHVVAEELRTSLDSALSR